MKIGAQDVNWWSLSFKDRLRISKELGYEGVQFWYTLRELGFSESVIITNWPREHKVKREYLTPSRFAKLVDTSGLEAQSFGPFNILGPKPFPIGPAPVVTGKEREERLKEIKGLMEFAAEAGVKILICGSGGDPYKPEQWTPLLEFMNELVAFAEKVDVILAIENSPLNLVADDDDLLKLMKKIKSKALRVHFDPANLNLCPPGNKDVPGAIRKLKGYIVSAHAKDAICGGGPYGEMYPGIWSCPPMGKGTTPWKECLTAFKEIGYTGYLIIEELSMGKEIDLEKIQSAMSHEKEFLKKLLSEIER